jgi:hypothetical protein
MERGKSRELHAELERGCPFPGWKSALHQRWDFYRIVLAFKKSHFNLDRRYVLVNLRISLVQYLDIVRGS